MSGSTARGFLPPEDVEALYLEKLASSGLTPENGQALGMSYLTGEETKAAGLWPQGLPALKIPYFDPWTGKPLAPGPGWPGFWRARALRLPANPDKKFAKYLQPPKTGVCAYFPQPGTLDWPELLANPHQMLLITEGELKAAKACAEVYPTIGLGGIFNYQSSYPNTTFLPELEKITWPRRLVYIIYDSDLMSNPLVSLAAWRLTCELADRGAVPYLVMIPSDGDKKTGLDDFLLANGRPGLDQLLGSGRPLSVVQSLWELNERYAAMLEGDQEVVDTKSGSRLKATQLKYRTTKRVSERRLLKDGSISYEPISAAVPWLDWPLRREVRRLLYDPSQPAMALIPNDWEGHDFNTWPGLAVEPKAGDVQPFLTLVDHLFTGAEPWVKEWFFSWLAYPLQHLGTKLLTAVVLHGLVHGSGKTLVGETMRRIYGSTYTKIGQRELTRDFNEWAASRSFILGDDITGWDKAEISDSLKVMITQTTMRINPKGLTPYELDDHISWLFTSNRSGAIQMDNGDRRFFVWEVPQRAGKLPREFYKGYLTWLDGEGASALLHWFLNYDVSKFDPGDAAPETSAKQKMREEARSDLANWVEDLRFNADALLSCNNIPMTGDLFSNKQLRFAFANQTGARDDDPRLSARMGAALAASGFNQVHNRKPVSGEGITIDRYYAIRNPDKWASATLAEIQQELRGPLSPTTKQPTPKQPTPKQPKSGRPKY